MGRETKNGKTEIKEVPRSSRGSSSIPLSLAKSKGSNKAHSPEM